jgi:prepilin-type N-terminal cleavage/methylation domain-containing protein
MRRTQRGGQHDAIDHGAAVPEAEAAGDRAGYSLVELILVVGVLGIVAAVAIPQSLGAIDRSRTWAAARYLGSRAAYARANAAARGTYVALRFEGPSSDLFFSTFVDGNGNGVRTTDIGAGIDRRVDTVVRLSHLYPGVNIEVAPTAGGGEGLRIGSSRMLSFSPLGTATPGTIYVRGRDDTQLAVRVLGATGRTRLLQYDYGRREWRPF